MPSKQTKSKGNFIQMSLYGHLACFQPQAICAKQQTFSNCFAPSPCEAGRPAVTSRGQEERVGVWGYFAPPTPLLCFSALGFAFSEMLFAEMLTRYLQTESKGNFCLITVYSHKNFLQPQNTRARKQTFSNRGLL
jgi:hypothetical protein